MRQSFYEYIVLNPKFKDDERFKKGEYGKLKRITNKHNILLEDKRKLNSKTKQIFSIQQVLQRQQTRNENHNNKLLH